MNEQYLVGTMDKHVFETLRARIAENFVNLEPLTTCELFDDEQRVRVFFRDSFVAGNSQNFFAVVKGFVWGFLVATYGRWRAE